MKTIVSQYAKKFGPEFAKYVAPAFLALTLLLAPGCTTTGSNPGNPPALVTPAAIQSDVSSAVGLFATFRIASHPESKPAFERALKALNSLQANAEAGQPWSVNAFAEALASAGGDLITSEKVSLIVSAGTVIVNTAVGGKVDLTKQEYAKAVILGAQDGLARALKN